MRIKSLLVVAAVLLLAGCAGTSRLVVDPDNNAPRYTTAYLVIHGGNSSDMDSALTAALMRQHLNVQSGITAPTPPTQQYVVTYTDDWSWDLVMYLNAVSVSIHDGQNRNIIAHGTWENSFMHSFPDVNEVVGELVQNLFRKM